MQETVNCGVWSKWPIVTKNGAHIHTEALHVHIKTWCSPFHISLVFSFSPFWFVGCTCANICLKVHRSACSSWAVGLHLKAVLSLFLNKPLRRHWLPCCNLNSYSNRIPMSMSLETLGFFIFTKKTKRKQETYLHTITFTVKCFW